MDNIGQLMVTGRAGWRHCGVCRWSEKIAGQMQCQHELLEQQNITMQVNDQLVCQMWEQ